MRTTTYFILILVSVASFHSVSLFILQNSDIEISKYKYAIEYLLLLCISLGILFVYRASRFAFASMREHQNVKSILGRSRDVSNNHKTKGRRELTTDDYANMLRQQQGMTIKFVKKNDRFIHTVCDGMLLYKLGLQSEDVIGKDLYEFLPYDIALEQEAYYQKAWDGHEDVVYEGCLNDIVYLATFRPIYKHGKVVEVIASCTDITALKKTLSALHESEERFRQIAENISELFWIADPVTLQFLYLSPAYEKTWGFSRDEFFRDPHKMFRVIHPDDRERVKQAQQDLARGDFSQEYRIICPDGAVRWIRDRGFPVVVDGKLHRIVGIAEDITEIRDNEELLVKTEKLAVLGELAAGIAHEIRNPLTTLRGFVQLLQAQSEHQNSFYMEIMLSEINRINEIVGEFLVLAKPTTANHVTKDIRLILQQVIMLMEMDCTLHNITIAHTFDCEQYLVECEENHLKQVFINIIKNAIEAMPNGGKVTIDVTCCNDEFIRIRIKDSGCGISEERIRSIGEPFYTTKEKGTGLGLMVSYKIIYNHRGKVEIYSKENEGTTVEIFLPFLLAK